MGVIPIEYKGRRVGTVSYGSGPVHIAWNPDGLTTTEQLLVSTAVERFEIWMEGGLPYCSKPLDPNTKEFWDHARKLLSHGTRLGVELPA